MPYFVIFVFLIRATTLEGAIDGIRFYLEPDWSKLKSINVRGGGDWELFIVEKMYD